MDEEDGLSEYTPLINPAEEEYDTSSSARYGRAVCLILELGCQTIKNFIINKLDLDRHYIEQDFTRLVNSKERLFMKLKNRILTDSQWQVLFPITGLIKMQSIDITLWILIGRNLVKETTIQDWKRQPFDYEIMPGHDFVRIRETRNRLAHSPPELSYEQFQSLWQEISEALIRLGATQQNIESYKTRDLDSDTTEKCILKVKNQYLEEINHVNLQGIQTKLCVKTAVILMAIIAVISVVSVLVPVVTLMEPQKPCSDYKIPIELDMVINEIPRAGWRAKPPKYNQGIVHTPVPYVIVSHTGFVGRSFNTEECCGIMREIQDFSVDKKNSNDIMFSYVIGNDGTVFEGRGLYQIPATALGWNRKSISLAFMGIYWNDEPSQDAYYSAKYFINYLRLKGTLASNFTLYGLCQVRSIFPCSPGPEIYTKIQKWKDPNGTWGWKPFPGSNCNTTCK